MAREIERKFLVVPERWLPGSVRGIRLRQGYLSTDPHRVVRVRLYGDEGFLTVKGRNTGIERAEFEYPIPGPDAALLLDSLCLRPLIEKVRYRIPFDGRIWEVDVFEGENAGLILAEVELERADAAVTVPPWVDHEVSGDARYYNSNLIVHPYRHWSNE